MNRKLALSYAVAGGILVFFILILLALFCLPLMLLALLLLILGLGILKKRRPDFFAALRKPDQNPLPLSTGSTNSQKHPNPRKTYLELIGVNASNRDTITVNKPRFVIGRNDGCDYKLDDPTISRRHAIIEYDENDKQCYIQSYGISGTVLNNQTLIKGVRYPLCQGDTLHFSSIMFTVEMAHF